MHQLDVGLKRYIFLNIFKFDIFTLDYVIIPVHLTNHWVCAIINFKLKRFEYYDSLRGKNARCLSVKTF
jgi:sentrin-specific protease 1